MEADYPTEQALRRLLGKKQGLGPWQVVSLSELGKDQAKAEAKTLLKIPTEKPKLSEEKSALLEERQEIEALRLLNQTGLADNPLPAPKNPILRLVAED